MYMYIVHCSWVKRPANIQQCSILFIITRIHVGFDLHMDKYVYAEG